MFGLFRKKQGRPKGVPPLSLFNTLSGAVEPLAPERPPKVTFYTCGPTVYDYVHIGNLRAFVVADILKRTLLYNGFEVQHTMNITDFGHLTSDADEGDDKMIVALRRAGLPLTLENMRKVADGFIATFEEDIKALRLVPADNYPRASDYVKQEISLIETLVQKGYTYETTDGLYFDISRFPTYSKLGNIDLDAQKAGARVETNPEKRHPADFALWKKGELGWESPWGKGFPGWHIECTAMVFATLGKQIDIHSGGIDHIGTHHNGEIAQAEAATGKTPFVRHWLHSAFITIDGKKVSKSLANTITLRQLHDRGYNPDVYRYWLLSGHHRSPMNFTFEALDGAKQALYRLKRHIFEEYGETSGKVIDSYQKRFQSAINNDLDTPKALALISELIKDEKQSPSDKVATLRDFDRVLGIGLSEKPEEARESLGVVEVKSLSEEVRELVEARENARKEKDWEEADALREEINLKGFLVEDTPEGPKVHKSQ